MQLAVEAKGLSKSYKIPVKREGLRGALKGMVKPSYRITQAVKELDLRIEEGELVGFIGPNGAGKTTVLKMCSGILTPTSGEIHVLGHMPSRRRADYLRQISFVMGQRNQLWWDIPAVDSFTLNRDIYDIPERSFRERIEELASGLDVMHLLNVPVRNLSLGERMKMEIIGALLHQPRMVFMDEPTVGLDLTSQRSLRAFIKRYNQVSNTTIMLTSHYMADIVSLCQRIIVIHEGRTIYDGDLATVQRRMGTKQWVKARFAVPPDPAWLELHTDNPEQQEGLYIFRVERQEVPSFLTALGQWQPQEINVEDPPVEDAIEQLYAGESCHEAMD
ncbi:ABC transporter ATP-binding protein [Paenibacillus massiliensis]|uniref:ABC transporter ATP-binding protein n=1 Tax=Paenibacillus massiliensis TaxID=225917 RepID=UPI000361AAA1|nr:ATP-binding cassette domain-containing protein [Paenibacillus massiliensis]